MQLICRWQICCALTMIAKNAGIVHILAQESKLIMMEVNYFKIIRHGLKISLSIKMLRTGIIIKCGLSTEKACGVTSPIMLSAAIRSLQNTAEWLNWLFFAVMTLTMPLIVYGWYLAAMIMGSVRAEKVPVPMMP